MQHEANKATGGCPVQHKAESGGCPVDKEARSGMMDALGVTSSDKLADTAGAGPAHNTPANDMAFGQELYPGQKVPLSTHRTTSTIPNVRVYPMVTVILYINICLNWWFGVP